MRRRLEQYRADRLLPYEQAAQPQLLAEAVISALHGPVEYFPVESDGARRAAAMLAKLL